MLSIEHTNPACNAVGGFVKLTLPQNFIAAIVSHFLPLVLAMGLCPCVSVCHKPVFY